MEHRSRGVDLLVVGGGMAGLTAAASTAQRGGSVVLVERAATLGGSARFAGYLHTATSVSALTEADPSACPGLQAGLVEGFREGVEWVRSLGVECQPEVHVLRLTRGHHIDTEAYIRACASVLRKASNADIMLDTRTDHLAISDGEVIGAVVSLPDGREETIEARSTLLATGGFQGDPDLVAEYIHPNGPLMPLRSNPVSRGDGLRLGIEVGAAVGPKGAAFYGHLVPWGVELEDPSQFTALSQYHSDHGLLFNIEGQRFIDETHGDHVNATAVLEQPEARALLVIDERVRKEWMLAPLVEGMGQPPDSFEQCLRRGGRCAVAYDVDEFEYLPEDWGYPGEAIRDAIRNFNVTVESASNELASPRRFDSTALVDPPYYVMDVRPAITFSYPGLVIDSLTRVLDEHGRPIPGLLAAGADAGGTFAREYAGGLANALVFGRQAAQTSMTRADPRAHAVHR
jgi:succinate dehydrogenase/fumarate reductase flavoprotein subunit